MLAAHHLRDCSHIVEIGCFQTPITEFLTTVPKSVTVIDPKVKPFHADQLNGHPCIVKHIPALIQDHKFVLERGTYGLVMLGFALEFPRDGTDTAERTFRRLVRLIDNARVTVLEHPPCYKPSVNQVTHLLARTNAEIVLRLELDFHKDAGAIQFNPRMRKAYLLRRFLILKPKTE